MTDKTKTTAGDELIELDAPPAPPVLHSEEEPAAAGKTKTPPAKADEELELEQPERHPSSAGFGMVAKFTGAVEDLEQQGGYHDRWQDAREANGEPRTTEAGK